MCPEEVGWRIGRGLKRGFGKVEHLWEMGGTKGEGLEFEFQGWEYRTVGTPSVGHTKVVKILVEILGGWEKDGLRVGESSLGKLKTGLGTGGAMKFGLGTLGDGNFMRSVHL